MAKKRKSDASRLDEVERGMHSTFCSAANSLSQIYTQAMNQQKVSFQAGERHSMEKLYQWILRQHEETSRVTAADIVAYLQHEMENYGEDSSMSPRYQAPQHPLHSSMHNANSSIQTPSGSFGQATAAHSARAGHIDQTKNSVFSNALSSPVRRTLQSYHLPHGGESFPDAVLHAENESSRNHEANTFNQNKDPNSNDSSMDMHSDSPSHDSY